MVRRHALRRADEGSADLPSGGIGLMVYGSLGRTGVYETQAALRMVHALGNASETSSRAGAAIRPLSAPARAIDAFELLASLPKTSPLRRNTAVWRSDEVRGLMGDAGVHDLLLHPIDVPFTRPMLLSAARRAGLVAAGWLQPSLYDWRHWLHSCNDAFAPCTRAPPLPLLRSRVASLDTEHAAAFTELLAGHARKHWVYLQPLPSSTAFQTGATQPSRTMKEQRARGAVAHTAATGLEYDLAPCVVNMSEHTLRALAMRAGREFRVSTDVQGEPLLMAIPPLASAILSRIDCRTTLSRLALLIKGNGVASAAPSSTKWSGRTEASDEAPMPSQHANADFDAQWRQLYRALHGIGYLFMSDVDVSGLA